MSKPGFLKTAFCLTAAAILSAVPLSAVSGSVPASPPVDVLPSGEFVRLMASFKLADLEATEQAKQEVFVSSYTAAAPVLDKFKKLKAIKGSKFDFSIKSLPDGTFEIPTNVKQKPTGEPITVTATPDGVFCAVIDGEASLHLKDDKEEGEDSGPVTTGETNPAEIVRIVAQRAEETGRIPAGSWDKIDNDAINQPSSPQQNLRQHPDSSEDDDLDIASRAGHTRNTARHQIG